MHAQQVLRRGAFYFFGGEEQPTFKVLFKRKCAAWLLKKLQSGDADAEPEAEEFVWINDKGEVDETRLAALRDAIDWSSFLAQTPAEPAPACSSSESE